MKLIPFRRGAAPVSQTEDRGYTDVITNALVEASADTQVNAYVSALEVVAGQLSRAFASATVAGPGAPAFTPWAMAQIGRQLIEEGEAVWRRVGQRLERAETWEFMRGRYQMTIAGTQRAANEDQVLHVRWNMDVSSGRGVAPLTTARTLKTLMQRLEQGLSDEQSAAIGYLLPVPSDGDAPTVEKLKEDLAKLRGRIAIIETARAGWGESDAASARAEYRLARLGPDVPSGNVQLFTAAREAVLAACGYPVQLTQGSDGTAQREAWRRYLHGTVAPLGRLLASDANRIGLAVDISFDELFASDIMGRARAFQSLVGGGMSLEAAAAASGILTPND